MVSVAGCATWSSSKFVICKVIREGWRGDCAVFGVEEPDSA